MAFEKYIIRDSENPEYQPTIDLHLFRAIFEMYLDDEKTGVECQQEIEAFLSEKAQTTITLTTDEIADLADVITFIDGGADEIEKSKRLDKFYRTLICSVSSVNWWTTQAELKAKLNWR